MVRRTKKKTSGGRSSSFKYRDSDPTVVDRHAESSGDYDGPIKSDVPQFKPKEGKNRIRILPRTWDSASGPKHWAFPLYLHYGVGPDDAAYPCPSKMGWGECPICEERTRLSSEGAEKEDINELRPSLSQVAWVIDRNNEEDGPKIFRMPPKKVESQICQLSRDEDTGALLKIDHPDKGHDVVFTKSGSGLKTDYTGVSVLQKTSYVSDDETEQEEWLAHVEQHPIPDVFQRYDYDYISKVFGGIVSSKRDEDDDEEEEEEEDEAPPRSRRRSRRDEDDDEEEEIDDENEELDDDAGEEGGEEEEQDEADEEEEEEKPRRRTRKRRGGDLRDEVKKGLKKRKRRG